MRLTGAQLHVLIEIVSSLLSRAQLERLTQVEFGFSMSREVSDASSYLNQVFELVRQLEMRGQTEQFLRALQRTFPRNLELREFLAGLGLASSTKNHAEALHLTAVQTEFWQRRVGEVSQQVCLVERDGLLWKSARGTGFLVGPDQIMTSARIAGVPVPNGVPAGPLARVRVWFPDALFEEEGRSKSEGATYALAEDPIVFRSRGGALVLRLALAAGRDAGRGSSGSYSSRARGWIVGGAPPPDPKSEIVVIQFGASRAPAIAVGTLEAIVKTKDEARIRHRVSLSRSASGAPCFDAAWNLIGVHISRHGYWNLGIAAAGVVQELADAGFAWDASAGIHRTTASSSIPSSPSIPKGGAPSLDDIVRGFEAPTASDDPDDDVWDASDGLDVSPADRWAWVEAAAVTASFSPEGLQPLGSPSREGLAALLLESRQAAPAGDAPRFALPDGLRARALRRLAGRGVLARARAQNPGDAGNPVDAAFASLASGAQPTAADFKDPERLRAMLRVIGWLEGTVPGLPPAARVRAALDRAALVAPFRHLTRGFFAGREAELADLADFADGPEGPGGPPALLIHGPGGMGKSSLLAHFILSHSERDPDRPDSWRPFVYLDFDRPDLEALDHAGILLAIVSQIGSQVPALGERARRLVAGERRSRREERPGRESAIQGKFVPRASGRSIAALTDGLASMLKELGGPLVVVLDTLEEVQFATPDAVVPLVRLLDNLRARVPLLRPIFAGRADVEYRSLQRLPLGPLPPRAAEELLRRLASPRVPPSADLVRRIVADVGGNPLSLRLAAAIIERADRDGRASLLDEDEVVARVGDAVVQGRLFARILDHIHEEDVRKLAHPGLALRVVTPDLIRDVLAGPCGLGAIDATEATRIFDALAREVALVGHAGDGPGTLEVRRELRRILLEDFRNDPDPGRRRQRREIHEAAVEFYSRRSDARSRAEEIYHRLSLDQDPADVDRRWISGIDGLLRDALGELPRRARGYLAGRVGVVVEGDAGAHSLPLADWEARAEKRAVDLLQLGLPASALEVLADRSDRLPASRLHLIESVARRSLARPVEGAELERAAACAAGAVQAARASKDPGRVREALDELIVVERRLGRTESVLRALAELGNLGDQLGDDLVLLRSQVESLEAIVEPDVGDFSSTAIRVFGRLPDELVTRAPELARRVAVQVGEHDRPTLARVLRLVGVGKLDPASVEELRGILCTWEERVTMSGAPGARSTEGQVPETPTGAAPDPSSSTPAPASFVTDATPAVELASLVRYYAATRPLDAGTARGLCELLRRQRGSDGAAGNLDRVNGA